MHDSLSAADIPSEISDYHSFVQLPIQWGDQDAFGHVNNIVPIRWFESGRIAYLERTELAEVLQQNGIRPILASVKCDYRRQLHYPDTVLVGSRVNALGGASMTMEHVVYSRHQESVAAEGTSIVVAFNYEKNRPVRMNDLIRRTIAAAERRDLTSFVSRK